MKILMVSYYTPLLTKPRSFRVNELAKELRRRGHEVNIYSYMDNKIYTAEEEEYRENTEIVTQKSKRFPAPKFLKRIYRFFFLRRKAPKEIKNMSKSISNHKNVDICISVSDPFIVQMASARVSFPKETVLIMDSGDPFYNNPICHLAFYWKYIERAVYKKADYVCIPDEMARGAYKGIVDDEKIRVIPQGINFDDFPPDEYIPGDIPRFVYAGTFYEDIRNPLIFLEYLIKCDEQYVFDIYMSNKDAMYEPVNEYAQRSEGRIRIHSFVTRQEIIKIMSKADFLINFENLSNCQKPSKLIDYGLAKRPVLSFSEKSFDPKKFERFMHGDYSGALQIDIDKYDIKKVADSFEQLFHK